MGSLATTTDRKFLESLVYGLEARYMNPANQVNWLAMRAGMDEEMWRRYISLRRQLQECPRLDKQ